MRATVSRAVVWARGVRGAAPTIGQRRFERPHAATRAALATQALTLRKDLGQHLLKNPETVRRIVDCADIQPTDHVLEIGPGTGNLTVHLLERAGAVTAVELDDELFRIVNQRVDQLGFARRFRCIRGDALHASLPTFDIMVANVPYQISSPLLERLFTHQPAPKRAVLMFQKEFADRMVAKPGSSLYSRLSVNTQLMADVERVLLIGKNEFRPPPKVDSAVVRIVPRATPLFRSITDFKEWNAMLKRCFMGKNKTLHALFSIKAVVEELEQRRQRKAVPGTTNVLLDALPHPPSTTTPTALFDDEEIDDINADDGDDGATSDVPAGARRAASSRGDRSLETTRNHAASSTTSDSRWPESMVVARQRVLLALERAGLDRKRPNAMGLDDFERLYGAIHDAGYCFTDSHPLPKRTR